MVFRALVLATAAVAGSVRVNEVTTSQPHRVEIRVVATTDLHGRVRGWDYYADSAEAARGLSRMATIVDSVRRAVPGGTILVDAGDFLQGNALTYVASRPEAKGVHPVIAAMNAMRYDAVVLGNHEFDYGLPVLDRALANARFPVLAANTKRLDGGRAWASVAWVTRGGARIAVVGLTTPWAMVWNRSHLDGRVAIDDVVSAARTAVRDARAAGAAAVVVVAHAGIGGGPTEALEGMPPENPMDAVAREVPGIDLVVYGHTHREIADTTINGVLLVQPRNWATSAAVAALTLERVGGGWRVAAKAGRTVQAAGHAESPAVVQGVREWHERARRYATTTIGNTDEEWTTARGRTEDTPIIDFIGETMRRATGADLASTAVFSTNVRFASGPVTVARMAQLYPYDNTIRVVKFSGDRLKAYLEHSARYFRVTGAGDEARAVPDPAFIGFNFEVVTGADYTIDLARAPGDRVTGLAVRGRPVTASDTFTIALTNYRASGTGGYTMVPAAPVVSEDSREIRQLLIDEATRRRTFAPREYATPSWRLVPASLAAQVQRALDGTADFEAVRRTPSTAATTLRIIATNDFHGALEARPDGNFGMRGGAAQVATVIRRLEAECTGTCASVHVDGGDQFQGTPASNLAFGRPVVDFFNGVGLAAAAIGNHDLDWTVDTLRARMRDARYAFLGANITDRAGQRPAWVRPDTLVERGGVRVGIIGLATVATPSLTIARNVADLRFLPPAPVVIERARSLRQRGADVVIVIAHAGWSCTGAGECNGEMAALARDAAGSIDAIVGGHQHNEVASVIAGAPVMRSRSSGRGVAYLDLPVARAARTAVMPRIVLVGTDTIPADPAIERLVAASTAPVRALVDRPIANLAETLRRGGPQHALGNLIADAQRAAARADVAVMNNGGIRADLRAGAVTYGAMFEVQPFANLLVRITATGADLRAYFEQVLGGASGVHVSGATIRYDPAAPAGARISAFLVNGAPLEPARIYTVAMSDFMATGGDGLAFAGASTRTEALGIVDLDALVDFVRGQPGGTVRPDTVRRIVPVAPR